MRERSVGNPLRYFQCDQIMAKTPNLDVLEVQMSLTFGKMSLGVFCRFQEQKGDFHGVFNFERFSLKKLSKNPFLRIFSQKITLQALYFMECYQIIIFSFKIEAKTASQNMISFKSILSY